MVLPFGLNNEAQRANRSSVIPSAPPMEGGPDSTANIRLSPYVDFIIMNNDERHLIRTERRIILESSVELAKIISTAPTGPSTTSTGGIGGGRRNENQFLINNVNKNDFELVIRYLETKFIKFRDHNHILATLEIADRFNCPDLVIHCVKELDLILSSMNVLDVFRSLWYYSCITPSIYQQQQPQIITTENNYKSKKKRKEKTCSAKKDEMKNNEQDKISSNNLLPSSNSAINGSSSSNYSNIQNRRHNHNQPFTPEEYLSALLTNSLQLIDMQAELILTKSEMLELRFEELEMIAKRDTLQLRSELTLFFSLADWSVEECKRKKLDPNAENRRRVLGPLCYTPKYLVMSAQDFRKACDRVYLLDVAEMALVNDAIENKKIPQGLTMEQQNLLQKFRTPRPAYTKLPIYLSDRTNPKNYSKKMRRAEYRSGRGGIDGNRNEDSCCQNFGLNCLAIFACIFD